MQGKEETQLNKNLELLNNLLSMVTLNPYALYFIDRSLLVPNWRKGLQWEIAEDKNSYILRSGSADNALETQDAVENCKTKISKLFPVLEPYLSVKEVSGNYILHCSTTITHKELFDMLWRKGKGPKETVPSVSIGNNASLPSNDDTPVGEIRELGSRSI